MGVNYCKEESLNSVIPCKLSNADVIMITIAEELEHVE